MQYVIITPARNEEKYIERTIHSVFSQTVKPMEWIIVNDGSTDGTQDIIDSYANRVTWLKVVNRTIRANRMPGTGVMKAFYDGYNLLESSWWDFIVKLDSDLSFQEDYFEKCFSFFKQDNRLGIGGGGIYHINKNQLVLEKVPTFHVRGATKIYRRKCWEEIGELIKSPGWDTLDEVKANMLGWRTRSFSEIKVIHHKFTGSADGSLKNMIKNGRANYISGYHPLFMLLKCIKRSWVKPYLVSSLGLSIGFISGYILNIPQINDKKLISYLRMQQINKLLFKPTIWK